MPTVSSATRGVFTPRPVSEQDYQRYWKVDEPPENNLNNIPEVPSVQPKTSILASTPIRVALALIGLLVVGSAVGVPLGIVLSSTTTVRTTNVQTTVTTATTTSATTTTATTATTTTTTTATTTTSTTSVTTTTTTTTRTTTTTATTTTTTTSVTTTTTATTTTTTATTTTTTTTRTTTTTATTTTTTTSVTTTTTATTTTTTTTATTTTTTTTTSVTTTTTTTSITAALTAYGPQLNFDPRTLSSAWSLCYSALYSVGMFPNISSILATCNKNKLLLGCRPVGNIVLTLAAMGNRADVLYNCSASSTLTYQANGVGWYFSMNTPNWNAWGFVSGSDSSSRGNCDGDMSINPAYRLCWHMVGSAGGWRCGTTGSLDNSNAWEKVIYHAM